jgi:ABC-type transport system involved in multi-copper enzyme maturation permease subunit
MPIFDQGYRAYEGELRRKSPWPVIAWENFRTRLTRPVWAVLLVAWIPVVLYGLFLYVKSTKLAGAAPGSGSTTAFSGAGAFDPVAAFAALAPGSAYMFWNFFQTQIVFVLLVPAVACGGVLGEDRKTGALQVYFARPVTRGDYLVGKFVTIAAFVAAVTLVPALVLWLESILLAPTLDHALATIHVPLAATLATVLYALFAGGLCLALSSLFTRRMLASIAMMLVYLAGSALGLILTEALDDRAWRQLSPNYFLGGMVAPLFGLDLPEWLGSPSLIASCVLLPIALLAWSWERTRSVEVET